MPINGTITVTTSTNFVLFSTTNANFRARALYLSNLTAGNSVLVDISSVSGNTTGYTISPSTQVQFPSLPNGITGFSVIASTAAGSLSLSYLASR